MSEQPKETEERKYRRLLALPRKTVVGPDGQTAAEWIRIYESARARDVSRRVLPPASKGYGGAVPNIHERGMGWELAERAREAGYSGDLIAQDAMMMLAVHRATLETSETSRDRPLGDAASARIEDIRKQWSVLPESGTMNEQEVRQVVHIARTHIAYLLGIIDSRSSPPREEREP